MPTGQVRAIDQAYRLSELSLGVLPRGPSAYQLTTYLVPVRGYAKGCSAENVEFVGIAA
jgi:hypothetical protein